jgi:hypothetical protein
LATLTGGDALNARLAEIAKSVTKSATLTVGFMEGASYPDGTSVPMVAAIQEFGAPARNIPPRPFFRNMIAAKAESWPDAVAALLEINDYDATHALMQTGEAIKGQLQQSIKDTNSPPLAPATIARKGFDKPLIDTGVMINSIDYKVE